MVHMKPHMPEPDVKNIPHQHAFVLVGDKTHFAVHMAQFHCELHKYQLIFKITLNGKDDALRDLRKEYPDEALFFCNSDGKADWFSIPSVAAGNADGSKKELRGNIFVGMRPFPPPDQMPPHFFPWKCDRAIPAITDVTVTVERIVLFRPYAHHEELPDFATYFLWGEGSEAHITNKQIAMLSSSEFETRSFGPDVDSVGSLAIPPSPDPAHDPGPVTPVDWLEDTLLTAGTVITIPSIHVRDLDTGDITIPPEPPLTKGQSYSALYRGITPARAITAGSTFMYCTAVINTPDRIPNTDYDVFGIFPMPKKYWGSAP